MALDHILAKMVDLIQFRCVDNHVEAGVAAFFQEVQKLQGRTAVEITGQFKMQAVTLAVLEDSEIICHGTPP